MADPDHSRGSAVPAEVRPKRWPWIVAGLLLVTATTVRLVAERRYGLPIGLVLLAAAVVVNHLVDRRLARRGTSG
ncbi:hypothetical protein [Amycolatopsis sp. CA-128772]|uniref:hypothetical protein n=1 Tax=Amycolatopsis sp. CA-128772 TaxID=2073159 RepID=UPI000CD03A3B|nr:hypothetical protein [Amycolatopsis sp. CA-128772]